MQLNDFITDVNRLNSVDELKQLYLEFLEDYGYTSFTLGKLTHQSIDEKNDNFDIMANYPEEWLQRYKAQEYVLHDPVYQLATTNFHPFSWKEITDRRLKTEVRLIMDEATDFGLHSGLGFPVILTGRVRFGLAISSAEPAARIDNDAVSVLDYATKHLTTTYLNIAGFNSSIPPNLLSVREREVLLRVAQGLTKQDIAEKIGVSYSSIKRYCESIFRKLDVNNLPSAVAVALRNDYINY